MELFLLFYDKKDKEKNDVVQVTILYLSLIMAFKAGTSVLFCGTFKLDEYL